VVSLAAATYTIADTVTLKKGVVLRGAGGGGASKGGTTIARTGGGSVLAIGDAQDQICYASAHDVVAPLADPALKETSKVHVGSDAGSFHPGDLAVIDELDDADVDEGDCPYFKRADHRSTSERVEIASVDAAAGMLTLTTPLHWTFRSDGAHAGQIARVAAPAVKWAGIEGVLLQGGTNPGYNGQMAGGIDISNAAYCWVKDVQTDETIGGMHVALRGTYRCVVRDSYFHHSADYGFGHDCYGVVIACGAADGLVENDVVRYMNKPILFNVSGGGNVVGYNYVDDSWATPPEWQEVNIDTHCAFPHMELIEGNWSPHVGATITHGNAGYLTFYRNYASSQFAPPPVAGFSGSQTGNMEAVQFQKGDLDMNVVGNVLGSDATTDLHTAPISATYVSTSSDVAGIFNVDDKADVEWTSLFAHGNWDTVNASVVWDPSSAVRTLPPSLYLASKPAWWPAASAWPWAGSDLTPRVGMLPAKTRAP
jgi:hypothetical protein